MSRFGELIQSKVPVLINFSTDWNEQSVAMDKLVKELATEFGSLVQVIRIDVDKNQELADALRIKGLPTLMIYKDGQMLWRESGEITKFTLTKLLAEYIS